MITNASGKYLVRMKKKETKKKSLTKTFIVGSYRSELKFNLPIQEECTLWSYFSAGTVETVFDVDWRKGNGRKGLEEEKVGMEPHCLLVGWHCFHLRKKAKGKAKYVKVRGELWEPAKLGMHFTPRDKKVRRVQGVKARRHNFNNFRENRPDCRNSHKQVSFVGFLIITYYKYHINIFLPFKGLTDPI